MVSTQVLTFASLAIFAAAILYPITTLTDFERSSDSKTVEQKLMIGPVLHKDGTYAITGDIVGPNFECADMVNKKDLIQRVHYHHDSCRDMDKHFGIQLSLLYGVKMIVNALGVRFSFSCGQAKGESPNGAAYLWNMYSNNGGFGPHPKRNGENVTVEHICQICNGICTWSKSNLYIASDVMVSDWRHLTKPEFIPIQDIDDAVIHLSLGGGLSSKSGLNEDGGLFPHVTYIDLLKQAQTERGTISTIGIVTAPFEGSHREKFDRMIALDLVHALQEAFPEAKIRIHDSTIMESLARLVRAGKASICGCSIFCPYATLATEGIGFIYNPLGSQNSWVKHAVEQYDNIRVFNTIRLNGLLIDNRKTGHHLSDKEVLHWLRHQANIGNVDITVPPLLRGQNETNDFGVSS